MNARTKLIGTIALGAALLVPVAQAQSPDDRAGLRGPGGIAATQAATTSSHPDNRAVRGPGAVASSQTRRPRSGRMTGRVSAGLGVHSSASSRGRVASGQPRRGPRTRVG